MLQRAGYLLANGDLGQLTDLQWRAIPHMVVLNAMIDNGQYKGPVDDEVLTIEEYTKRKLGEKEGQLPSQKRKYYVEPSPVTEWTTMKVVDSAGDTKIS
ncbi:MAG TPA: hypothetical protein PK659_07465 [Methanothrix sp.]|nr:hypothetical protein [Methanothrix sp.]HOL44070.1 hypothetical protein [Methanothrix sp.]